MIFGEIDVKTRMLASKTIKMRNCSMLYQKLCLKNPRKRMEKCAKSSKFCQVYLSPSPSDGRNLREFMLKLKDLLTNKQKSLLSFFKNKLNTIKKYVILI